MSETSLTMKRWPLSNNFVLLSVLLLCATAIGLAVTTESAANRLATYAYYSLVVGVVLRLLELTIGRQIESAAGRVRSAVAAAMGTDAGVRVKSIVGYAGVLTTVTGGGLLAYWVSNPNTNVEPNLVLLFLVIVGWLSVVYRVSAV